MNKCPQVDYRKPSDEVYRDIFAWRLERKTQIENDAALCAALRVHYRHNPWDYINDWGVTFDPRNVELGVMATIPMVLWPKQVKYLRWIYASWRAKRRGLVEKSRDCGVSWLSVAFAGTMWLFQPEFTALFGSRVEELVDKRGDVDSLFEKLWIFLSYTPQMFKPHGFSERIRNHMRIVNPENRAAITGKAGDNIGRGGRSSIAFVDEAAFIEHQLLVDNALSQTTNCQIDISTPNGNGNLFYKKRMRFNNTDRIFVFDWRDDPRKDADWYKAQVNELDPVTVAQEIDRDYEASQEGSFIEAKWVKAAVDAHETLGFDPEGIRTLGFDPADVGDAKALVGRKGSVITLAEQKKDGEIPEALSWAFIRADDYRADALIYDGDGMGAPVMKTAIANKKPPPFKLVAYRGSSGVRDPGKPAKRGKQPIAGDRSNLDTYLNFRAQSWQWLRERFRLTYLVVTRAKAGKLVKFDPADLISIDSSCEDYEQLVSELSRPMRIPRDDGKIMVESKNAMKKRGVDSPNLADAAVIAFSENDPPDKKPKPLKTKPGPGKGSWMGR